MGARFPLTNKSILLFGKVSETSFTKGVISRRFPSRPLGRLIKIRLTAISESPFIYVLDGPTLRVSDRISFLLKTFNFFSFAIDQNELSSIELKFHIIKTTKLSISTGQNLINIEFLIVYFIG